MKKIKGVKAQGNEETGTLNRRGFLGKIMMMAAGGTALIAAGTTSAFAKVAKATAKYRSSPRNGKKCSGCSHYRSGGKCALVSGTVSGNGYCNYYSRKSGYSY